MNLWCTEEEEKVLRYGYRVNAVLHQEKTEFQQIDVIETAAYGRMLLLDGFVMLTETDEFVYHEMIAHVPACLHRDPRKVVVIGGGDGGTVRELLKHPNIEEITLCEIDGRVVDVCREYFPTVSGALSDPRVNVKIGDGVAHMRELERDVDIAVIDSTDPIGPGEGLFSSDFYKSVARALKPGGLMVAQSESPWFRAPVLQRIHRNISAGFPHVKPYVGPVPTYPRGLWSWTLASQDEIDPKGFDLDRFRRLEGLEYLTEATFSAVFSLPPFFSKKLVY